MSDVIRVNARASPSKAGGKTVPSKAAPVDKEKEKERKHSLTPSSSQQAMLSAVHCKHLSNRRNFLRVYYDLLRNIMADTTTLLGVCDECGYGGSPLYACLQCVHFSCHQRGKDCHYHDHNIETGHALSVEVSTGVLRCVVCRVHVWNRDLERVYRCAQLGLVPSLLKTVRDPSDDEPNPAVFTKHCVGVKGLYNLGNTCFMNSVLQPLFHIPDLAKYFLSFATGKGAGGHRKSNCKAADQPCVACELDALFVRMYNGKQKPVCPSEMLYAVWKGSAQMAGYEQQDAHEFFVCLRTALHKAIDGHQFNCNCIVHELFAGVLQSDLTCPHCHHKAETYDPFLDLSLDIVHHGQYMTSLTECLEHFTRPEPIAMDAYKCPQCGLGTEELHKRMLMRATPKVLVVHLKRFEHGHSRHKIDKPVAFPLFLDLQPYTVEYNEDPNGMQDFESAGRLPPYKLMSVVAHVGSLDSGHYTSYVRFRDDWFFIDDAQVTLTTEEAVLAAPAYMLFYTALSHHTPS